MLTVEILILQVGILLLAGVMVSRLADRLGVPLLLLFLAIGMLAGSEGIGNIAFDSPEIAQAIGTVALLIILYAGGLDTEWAAVRPVLAPGLLLSTVGVGLTTLLLGTFAWFLLGTYSTFDIGPLGLTWMEALLFAAIVSSTDAAAVFSVYRTSPVQPRDRLRALLEFESGSNDPMAVLLTTTLLALMTQPGKGGAGIAATLLVQFAAGGAIGAGVGALGARLANRERLSVRGLYPILVLAHGFLAFGLADWLGGNGFLAVYVAGLAIGNRLKAQRDWVMAFHDGLSWLMQISLFVMLGLLVFPSRLPSVAGVAIALALFLMFVARPISVALCLLPFRPARNELLYVSWVGLRGSVPIVLATFPATYGINDADAIFNAIFFMVVTSVTVQGLTLVPCARWLGVAETAIAPGSAGRSGSPDPTGQERAGEPPRAIAADSESSELLRASTDPDPDSNPSSNPDADPDLDPGSNPDLAPDSTPNPTPNPTPNLDFDGDVDSSRKSTADTDSASHSGSALDAGSEANSDSGSTNRNDPNGPIA